MKRGKERGSQGPKMAGEGGGDASSRGSRRFIGGGGRMFQRKS